MLVWANKRKGKETIMFESLLETLNKKTEILDQLIKQSEVHNVSNTDWVGKGVYDIGEEGMVNFFDSNDVRNQLNEYKNRIASSMERIYTTKKESVANAAFESGMTAYLEAASFVLSQKSRNEGFYDSANKAIYRFMTSCNAEKHGGLSAVESLAMEAILSMTGNETTDGQIFDNFLEEIESALNDEIESCNKDVKLASESVDSVADIDDVDFAFESIMMSIDSDISELQTEEKANEVADHIYSCIDKEIRSIDADIKAANDTEDSSTETPTDKNILYESLSRLAEDATINALASLDIRIDYCALESAFRTIAEDMATESYASKGEIYLSYLMDDEINDLKSSTIAQESKVMNALASIGKDINGYHFKPNDISEDNAMESIRFDFASVKRNIQANARKISSAIRTMSFEDVINIILSTGVSFYQSMAMRIQGRVVPDFIVDCIVPPLRKLNYEMAAYVDNICRSSSIGSDEPDEYIRAAQSNYDAIMDITDIGMKDIETLYSTLEDRLNEIQTKTTKKDLSIIVGSSLRESDAFIRMCNETQRQFKRIQIKASSITRKYNDDSKNKPTLMSKKISLEVSSMMEELVPYLTAIRKVLDYALSDFDLDPDRTVGSSTRMSRLKSVAPFTNDSGLVMLVD